MLKFQYARDSRDDSNKSVNELEKLNMDDETFKYLVCPNCDCPLVFHHASSNRGPYLSTRRGYKHSSDCVNRVEIELRREKYVSASHDNIYLSPSMQSARAINYYRRLKKIISSGERAPQVPIKRKISKSKRNNKKTKTIKGVSHRPTINPQNGKPYNNERIRMSAATPNNIARFLNRTIEFGGFLDQISINHSFVILYIKVNNTRAPIILDEAFFDVSASEYKNSLVKLKEDLTSYDAPHPLVTSIVNVVPRSSDGRAECLVRTDQALKFDGKSLAIYLNDIENNI